MPILWRTSNGCKYKIPHIKEDELKESFIKAANELFSEREEILANTKVMMEMVCETDSLDRDLQDSITELNIILAQMQIESKKAKRELFKGFIRTLEKRNRKEP
ncbi:MAG: hypothetical protein ACI4EX_11030 [Lachnospiraceae bacterium]